MNCISVHMHVCAGSCFWFGFGIFILLFSHLHWGPFLCVLSCSIFIYLFIFLFFLDRKTHREKEHEIGCNEEWRYSKKKFMSPTFPLLSIETTGSNTLEFFLESHAQGKKILNPADIQKVMLSFRSNFSEFWQPAENLTRETGAQTIMMGRTTPRSKTI